MAPETFIKYKNTFKSNKKYEKYKKYESMKKILDLECTQICMIDLVMKTESSNEKLLFYIWIKSVSISIKAD